MLSGISSKTYEALKMETGDWNSRQRRLLQIVTVN